MSDFDIGPRGPLLLGIAAGLAVDWLDPADPIRVRGRDLGEVSRKAAAARRDHPGRDVVVDIDVVIAPDAPAARAMRHLDDIDGDTLLYVGTPAGLAGLIADVHVLGIADGAVLVPGADGVTALLRNAVFPVLQSLTALAIAMPESSPA